MSNSIFDTRFPTGHGAHGTRHMLATVMSRPFSALLRKAYLLRGWCALTQSSSLQNCAISDLLECDEEKLTLVDLAWLAVSVVFVLTLCRIINLAIS